MFSAIIVVRKYIPQILNTMQNRTGSQCSDCRSGTERGMALSERSGTERETRGDWETTIFAK